jgi:hypothetical protein
MTREDVQAKAVRLVGSGRVTLRSLGPDLIAARVRGDSAQVYNVGWDPDGWRCDCEAVTRCSHIRAVQLVSVAPSPDTSPRWHPIDEVVPTNWDRDPEPWERTAPPPRGLGG